MNRNLANVGLVFVVIAAALALGLIWGARMERDWLLQQQIDLALAARPALSLVVLIGCGLAAWARRAQQAVPLLISIGLAQLVMAIVYAVWLKQAQNPALVPPVG